MHHWMAGGIAVLAAELVGKGVDVAIRRVVPDTSPYTIRMGARAVVTAVGYGLTQIPQSRRESTVVASARTAGRLAMAGGVGGMVYESGAELRHRYLAAGPVRPIVVGLGGFVGAILYSGKLLETRRGLIKRWSEDDTPASVPASLAIGIGVASAGRLIGRGFLASRRSSMGYFGDDLVCRTVGRAGADDRDALTCRRRRCHWPGEHPLPLLVRDEALQVADRDGPPLVREDTRTLALDLLRAHAPADRRERVVLVDHRRGARYVAVCNKLDEVVDPHPDGTAIDTDRPLAVQTARRLKNR